MNNWTRISECMRLDSPWVTLIGERWLCDNGKELDYWRVEKADSVIVLPIQAGQIFCIAPTFRPGIGRTTLDFPGGRLPEGLSPKKFVPELLHNELGVPPKMVRHIEALNEKKWTVNSSFSNQGLWSFTADIDEHYTIPEALVGVKTSATITGAKQLLAKLDCLQCRSVLAEWLHQQG